MPTEAPSAPKAKGRLSRKARLAAKKAAKAAKRAGSDEEDVNPAATGMNSVQHFRIQAAPGTQEGHLIQ